MKNILLSLMFLFPVSVVTAQDTPIQSSQAQEIAELINQLGADKYEDREAAHEALAKIGKPAVKALMEARKSSDMEVASRADELIGRITGKRIKPKQPSRETPVRPAPQTPGPSFDPNDLKDMLDKLEDFGGLSPDLKKTIEGFQKLFEESQSGAPDLSTMQELFERFFKKTDPKLERIPSLDRELTKSAIEKELGVTLGPVNDAMKAHIRISPDKQDGSWDGLKQGLVVEKIDPKGRAFAQGLRQHDIVIFASEEATPVVALPGPWKAWNAWRSKATGVGTPENLKTKNKKLFVEVIRQGTSCRIIELNPTPKPKPKTKDTKDF